MCGYILTYRRLYRRTLNFVSSRFSTEETHFVSSGSSTVETLISASTVPHCWQPLLIVASVEEQQGYLFVALFFVDLLLLPLSYLRLD